MAVTKRTVEAKVEEKKEHQEEVNLDTLENLDKVRSIRAQLRKSADAQMMAALEEIGFHLNTWSFDPKYIRYLLFVGASVFSAFTAVAYMQGDSTVFGTYYWMFISYAAIFGALSYFWFYKVEHGGGQFIFSAGWRDSYVVTDSTSTNYTVTVYVGHDDVVKASIPYNTFELEKNKEVDMYWLADELERQFDAEALMKK